MSDDKSKYRMIVLTRRLKMPGVLETMSEQVPEVIEAMAKIEKEFNRRMASFDDGDWRVVSHAHSVQNGILIVTYLITL